MGAEKELPYIYIGIGDTITDGFAGVNNASTTYCQEKINLLILAESNSFTYFGKPGVGNYAAKSNEINTCFRKAGLDLINKTGGNRTVASIMDQDFMTAIFFQNGTCH